MICGFTEIIETIIQINEVIPDNYDSSIYESKFLTSEEDTC